MSMLTAQANHLREMAYTVERVKNDAIGKLSLSGSITLAMAAMDMRDAADTIARLRNTCHDLQHENEELNAENEKLRERVSELEELTDHRHYIPQEWYATLKAENAKLKALVRDMYACINRIEANSCDCDCTGYTLDGAAACNFEGRMESFGIEVDA